MTLTATATEAPARPRLAPSVGPFEAHREITAAKTAHPCDATGCPWCPGIAAGDAYDLWTVFPAHPDLGQRTGHGTKPYRLRVCAACRDFFIACDLTEILDPAVSL